MFCREQVAQLRDKVDEIRNLGAELVVVGNGKPFHALDFKQERDIQFPLLVDPELKAYAAAELKRGMGTVLKFGVLKNAVRSLGQGFRQGSVQGDPWQQGGTLVITPSNKILFYHVSEEAGDHASLEDILATLKHAKNSGMD